MALMITLTHTVGVDVRFVCKDTVEEKILALQKRKTALAANVLTGYDSVSLCR